MKNSIYILSALSFFLFISITATATHNIAGTINVQQTGSLSFIVSCSTYTKASSIADRDSLLLAWGDGSSEFIQRSNGNGTYISNDIKLNIYTKTHNYAGQGQFIISITDPNRNSGILNVNPPNSDQVPFYLETTFSILNNSVQGMNNTPIILGLPTEVAYQGQPFKYTPNAYDAEGDSIAYELVPIGTNYTFPHDLDNQLYSFNEETGEYIWTTPQTCGTYSLGYLIKEYRAGQLISATTWDMLFEVRCLNNRIPNISTDLAVDKICVFAGEIIDFNVFANELDTLQNIVLSATGGPLLHATPAQFITPVGYQPSPTSGQFLWQTTCNHVRKEPYQVVFKSTDNFEDSLGGFNIKIIQIQVLPTLPQNVQTNVLPNEIELRWNNFYPCDTSTNFDNFSIWRQECNTSLPIDSCITDLRIENYTLIANNISTLDPNGSGDYYYLDSTIEDGKTYCYRVLADFGFDFSVATETIIKNDNFNIKYYPNPIQSNQYLTIEIAENINNLDYEIHNLLGQKVSFGQLLINNQTAIIPMPRQENIYILSLSKNGQKVKSFQIIVKE